MGSSRITTLVKFSLYYMAKIWKIISASGHSGAQYQARCSEPFCVRFSIDWYMNFHDRTDTFDWFKCALEDVSDEKTDPQFVVFILVRNAF